MLWAPCGECRGAALALSITAAEAVVPAGERAMMMLHWLGEHGCINCNAIAKRRGDGALTDEQGQVLGQYWFDPICSDYVLTRPFGELPGGITVPLGLGAVDSPVFEIERACAAVMDEEESGDESS